jgi:hypothetical protein
MSMVSRSIISIFLKPNIKNLLKHVTKATGTIKKAEIFFYTDLVRTDTRYPSQHMATNLPNYEVR